jgi:hypothetical protein
MRVYLVISSWTDELPQHKVPEVRTNPREQTEAGGFETSCSKERKVSAGGRAARGCGEGIEMLHVGDELPSDDDDDLEDVDVEHEEEEEEDEEEEDDFDEQEAADFLRGAEEGSIERVRIVREKPELLEVQDEVSAILLHFTKCAGCFATAQRAHCMCTMSVGCDSLTIFKRG